MTNAIEVKNLRKKFATFTLDDVSFTIPQGFVCGFIGKNGSGKTTTLKLLMGMLQKDTGDIQLMGKSATDFRSKSEIAVLFDQPYYQEDWTPLDVEKALRPFYPNWNSEEYHQYLRRFSLEPKQKFKSLSRGMQMKLGLAVSLSHNAKLLILDEPAAGLDPVARDELLDILREYMINDERTIFFSTHITSDLEKIADFITYIDNGKIIYNGMTDDLLNNYCLIRGGTNDLPVAKRSEVIGLREMATGFEGMIDLADIGGFPPSVVTEKVALEDIMIYMSRRKQHG